MWLYSKCSAILANLLRRLKLKNELPDEENAENDDDDDDDDDVPARWCTFIMPCRLIQNAKLQSL